MAALLLLVPFSLALFLVGRLAFTMVFTYDETTYAHAAWLIAHGEIPYRDFALFHVPFTAQLFAPLFLLVGDSPLNILVLRGALVGLFCLAAWAVWRINSDSGRARSLLGPLLMVLAGPFTTQFLQIRPDSVAFTFFLLALACLDNETPSDKRRNLLLGIFLGLACWSSEKACVYGAPLLVVAMLSPARRLILLGLSLVAVSALGYLLATTSLTSFLTFVVEWGILHEQVYPARRIWPELQKLLFAMLPLVLLGLLNIVHVFATFRRLERRQQTKEWLLIASLVAAFLTYILQRGAFSYSLIPCWGLLIVLAVRGTAIFLSTAALSRHASLLLTATSVLFGALALQAPRFSRNDAQLATLRTIAQISAPSDPIYDNASFFVTRPHVGFFPFTDRLVRTLLGERLAVDIPQAIIAQGCAFYLRDTRLPELPARLHRFLDSHFLPLAGPIHVWGQSYSGSDFSDSFYAVRDGDYTIAPFSVLTDGVLRIDGRPIASIPFRLSKGQHLLSFSHPRSVIFSLTVCTREPDR